MKLLQEGGHLDKSGKIARGGLTNELKNQLEIKTLIAKHNKTPHLRLLQKIIAEEVTKRGHSKEDLEMAIKALSWMIKLFPNPIYCYHEIVHNDWIVEKFRKKNVVFVSATPGDYELNKTGGVFVEQVIRPTGLVDPPIEVRSTQHQIDNLLDECRLTIKKGYRIIITTLTKKMSEDLTEYMHEDGLKVRN